MTSRIQHSIPNLETCGSERISLHTIVRSWGSMNLQEFIDDILFGGFRTFHAVALVLLILGIACM